MFTAIHYAELCFVGTALLVSACGYLLLRTHLREVPRITTELQLASFAAMVRLQMYLAILFITACLPAFVLIFLERESLSLVARGILLVPYVLMFVGGALQKKIEKRARESARCDPAFLERFEQITYAWGKKLLPNF